MMTRIFLLFLLMLTLVEVNASQSVQEVRSSATQDATRVVLDLSGRVNYQVFTLSNPHRVVVDIADTQLNGKLDQTALQQGPIRHVRSGARKGDDLRLVLDVSQKVEPKAFLLPPKEEFGHRLVIDFPGVGTSAKNNQPVARQPVKSTQTKHISKTAPQSYRDVVVVIDAGHGGKDVGAIGANGTYEKNVVLAVSKKLAQRINAQPGMRAVLTRDNDQFIRLRDRTRIARENHADLFVSIHADSFRSHHAKGSSVYALSQRGATSEAARLLAEKENAADLIAGTDIDEKDEMLRSVLLDLSQTGAIKESIAVGDRVLRELRGVNQLHKQKVEQAGFAVLKSHDVPSILVELAFISNPKEERKLKDAKHQNKLADAILGGVKAYFVNTPPPGTLLALGDTKHVIKSGETLSGLSHKYNVTIDSIRSANELRNDTLRVGQAIRIPQHVGG